MEGKLCYYMQTEIRTLNMVWIILKITSLNTKTISVVNHWLTLTKNSCISSIWVTDIVTSTHIIGIAWGLKWQSRALHVEVWVKSKLLRPGILMSLPLANLEDSRRMRQLTLSSPCLQQRQRSSFHYLFFSDQNRWNRCHGPDSYGDDFYARTASMVHIVIKEKQRYPEKIRCKSE